MMKRCDKHDVVYAENTYCWKCVKEEKFICALHSVRYDEGTYCWACVEAEKNTHTNTNTYRGQNVSGRIVYQDKT